jgi:tRNA(Ile)-lysidine synthetase-like protein
MYIRKLIKQLESMSKEEKTILLSVSGGADSMFMANFFLDNYPHHLLGIFHLNHGVQSDNDMFEKFVKNHFKHIGCSKHYYNNNHYFNGILSEKNMRDIRLDCFQTIANKDGKDYDYIVTAHHKNDQVETILLDVIRGVHHSKLGMKEYTPSRFNDSIFWKPFLDFSKQEILRICDSREISYVQDLTNLDENYCDRNFVRNHLIPLLKMRMRNVDKSVLNVIRDEV